MIKDIPGSNIWNSQLITLLVGIVGGIAKISSRIYSPNQRGDYRVMILSLNKVNCFAGMKFLEKNLQK